MSDAGGPPSASPARPSPLAPRSPEASVTTMTELVLPVHTNALGGIFGGQIVAWMDLCAALCAQRHSNARVVTAGIDELTFERTVKAGQAVRLTARLTAAFRSSMEIFVDVHGEDAVAGETWPCVNAFLTFVAVDSAMKPVPVRPLLLVTDEDRAAEAAAHERRTARLGKRKK